MNSPVNSATFAEVESANALRAIVGSLRRMRRILKDSKPARWVEQHPVVTAAAAAGIATIITATACERTVEVQRESGHTARDLLPET